MERTTKMKILSLSEFANICKQIPATKFIFSSENQKDFFDFKISYNFTFNTMLTAVNPNALRFIGTDNTLQLESVKEIRLKEKYSPLGKIFIIVCESLFNKNEEMTFTIIVR